MRYGRALDRRKLLCDVGGCLLSANYEGKADIQSQLDRQHESGFAPVADEKRPGFTLI